MNSLFDVSQQDTDYIDLIERMSQNQPVGPLELSPEDLPNSRDWSAAPEPPLVLPAPTSPDSLGQPPQEIEAGFGLKFVKRETAPPPLDEDNYFDQYGDNEEDELKKSLINEIYATHVRDRYQSIRGPSVPNRPTLSAPPVETFPQVSEAREDDGSDPGSRQSLSQKPAVVLADELKASHEVLEESQQYLEAIYSQLTEPGKPIYKNLQSAADQLQRASLQTYLDQLYKCIEAEVQRSNGASTSRPFLSPFQATSEQNKYVKSIYERAIRDHLASKLPGMRSELLSRVASQKSTDSEQPATDAFLTTILAEAYETVQKEIPQPEEAQLTDPGASRMTEKDPLVLKSLTDRSLPRLIQAQMHRNSISSKAASIKSNNSSANTSAKRRTDKIKEIQRTFKKSRFEAMRDDNSAYRREIAELDSPISDPADSPKPTFDIIIEQDEEGHDKLGVLFKNPGEPTHSRRSNLTKKPSNPQPPDRGFQNPDALPFFQKQLDTSDSQAFFGAKRLSEQDNILSPAEDMTLRSTDSRSRLDEPPGDLSMRDFAKKASDAKRNSQPPWANGNSPEGPDSQRQVSEQFVSAYVKRLQSNAQRRLSLNKEKTEGLAQPSFNPGGQGSRSESRITLPDATQNFEQRPEEESTGRKSEAPPSEPLLAVDRGSGFLEEKLTPAFAWTDGTTNPRGEARFQEVVPDYSTHRTKSQDANQAELFAKKPKDESLVLKAEKIAQIILSRQASQRSIPRQGSTKSATISQKDDEKAPDKAGVRPSQTVAFPDIKITVSQPKDQTGGSWRQMRGSQLCESLSQPEKLRDSGQSKGARTDRHTTAPGTTTTSDELPLRAESQLSRVSRLTLRPLDEPSKVRIQIAYKQQIADNMNRILSKSRFAHRGETEVLLKTEMQRMVSMDFLFYVNALPPEEQARVVVLQRAARRMINRGIIAKISRNTRMFQALKDSIEQRTSNLGGSKYQRSRISSRRYYE